MDFDGYLMSGNLQTAEIRKGHIIPLDTAHLPLYLTAHDDLEGWLCGRAIDRHRPNSRILKKVLRLTDSGDLAAVLRTHAATITDNYWVKQESEHSLTYDKIRFSEDTFAEIALTGRFSSYSREYSEEQIRKGSPELTNIGSFEKCWRIIDGSWWLYKKGNTEERFSELLIASLGTAMGFPMAEYRPAGEFIKSRDFTEGRYNFEPAEALVGDEEDYAYNYDRLSALNPSLGKQYLDILFMDALCFNMDRHTKNYGILRSQDSGKILRMAPNFDNNIALIARGYSEDPGRTNGLLISLFIDFLEQKKISYQMPVLRKNALFELVRSTLLKEEIRRDYVTTMLQDRWERLAQGLRNIHSDVW